MCVYFWYVALTVLVGSVLLQDEAKGDSQMPVVINMDGADQRLAERQQQRQLVDEQVTVTTISYIVSCFVNNFLCSCCWHCH